VRPVKKMNPSYKKPIGSLFVSLVAISLLLPMASLLAQNDFRVSTGTGLEPEAVGLKSVDKKVKPVVVDERKATEITCTGETSFDAKAGLAVFIKDVKVADPQFSLTCEKLTAYLKKAPSEVVKSGDAAVKAEPKPEPSAEAVASKSAKSDAPSSPASGLERAVAEGNVLITQDKVDEKTGEVTRYVGKGRKADYNAVSGEMTLSGWPQIQQGANNQVATEEGTVMIMDKDGHLRTKGASMTVIKADAKPAKEKADKPEPAKLDSLKSRE